MSLGMHCRLRTNLCTTLNELCNKQWDDDVLYYHPDHLGGAAWITKNQFKMKLKMKHSLEVPKV